jgi:phage shock protein C
MKRLILTNKSDKVFAGVCGGLGKYFEVDPIIFRLGFGLTFFGWGGGLLVYIILAIGMPDEE